MGARRARSATYAELAPVAVKVPVGAMPAARVAKREPHLLVWSLARHVAGRAQDADRQRLHEFVQAHQIFSRSRLNTLIKEANGEFWDTRIGRVSKRPVLHLRGLGRVLKAILSRCPSA